MAATKKGNEISNIVSKMPSKPATSSDGQGILDLGIQKQVEIDGIGMGVLSDGTAFLTGRGLARLCGVTHGVIQDLSGEWLSGTANARVLQVKSILDSHDLPSGSPYVEIKQGSSIFYAYPDVICLAILEYYAFDAGQNVKEQAQKNYRLLAGKALRDFIYTQVGFDPENHISAPWRQFHDRVSLNYDSTPDGYFGIFKEIADMIVTLGQAGLHIDSKFIPDISVGIAWSKHWVVQGFDVSYGIRKKFEHNYPDYFPQAESNPQEPWCYPESALGEFRRWMRENYIGDGRFEKYIHDKVRQKSLPPSFAQLAIGAYKNKKQIE